MLVTRRKGEVHLNYRYTVTKNNGQKADVVSTYSIKMFKKCNKHLTDVHYSTNQFFKIAKKGTKLLN